MFFFFQAEDGIRDHCVTGVQTCALPISVYLDVSLAHRLALQEVDGGEKSGVASLSEREFEVFLRSEERRVGKECRSWGWPCHYRKKESYECSRKKGKGWKGGTMLANSWR